MTPAQVYAMTPEKVEKELGYLIGTYYDHIPEVGGHDSGWLWGVQQDRIELRFIKNFCYDGRRIWCLATVWFDGQPIMVIQNAGRGGCDYHMKFVTDGGGYMKMISFIVSLLPDYLARPVPVVGIDDEIEGLTNFYGQSLEGPFERYPH